MVSVGRILRDYRDAGSVNGLLALWGFVDDTTFLTKAGHVGVVYRIRGVDYEGLSHPQRQALAHRFEAALRLLDEHCRVYQYLLKRTVGPFVAAAVRAADRQRGDPAPRGLPERSPAGTLRPVAVPGAALRSAARRAAEHRASPRLAGAPPGLAGVALDRPHAAAPRIGARSGHRDTPPQGAGLRGADQRLRAGASRQAGRLPLLPCSW